MTQLEMQWNAAPPDPDTEEVQWILDWLRARPGFHPAKEIARLTGRNDRKIRQLAEHAAGNIVSGPGSPGYCHQEHCPSDTRERIVASLRSQARQMLERADRIERAAFELTQPALFAR
jgi:hypothetical protein